MDVDDVFVGSSIEVKEQVLAKGLGALEAGAVDKRCFRRKAALRAGDVQALGAKNAGEFVGKTVDDVSFRHASSLAVRLRRVRAGRWIAAGWPIVRQLLLAGKRRRVY